MEGNAVLRYLEREGPVTFRDYMEEALYGEDGYYATGGGPGDDFRTAPETHPAFAETFAELFMDAGFDAVLEAGAGAGHFAETLVATYAEEGRDLEYVAVDRSGDAREELRERVPEARVESSLDAVDGFEGVVFSNELLDALPVHAVEMRSGGLKEVCVDLDGGEVVETLQDAPEELERYFDWLDVSLPDGFRTEVNLEALRWLESVDDALDSGGVVTVDYGYRSEELYAPRRRGGTVTCFRDGAAFEDPYRLPGECDVTARVNLSAVEKRGEELGLEPLGLADQGPFLHSAGLEDIVERERERRSHASFLEWFVPVRRLIMPNGMGKSHRVLIQAKALDAPGPLLDALDTGL